MEERCGKLYKAIKVAYEDMSVRQNVGVRILLSASNEIIKSNDAELSAMHRHELNLMLTMIFNTLGFLNLKI